MNQFFYTKSRCGDVIEYSVTLETGTEVSTDNDFIVKGLIKTRYFDTHETAWNFLQAVLCFKHLPPFEALYKFNTFGIKRKSALNHVIRQNEGILHSIRFPDGSRSTRHAKLQGNLILCNTGKFYKSLTAFASAHYKDVHPTRKTANGWKECMVKCRLKYISCGPLDVGWISLAVLREIRL